MNNLITLLPPGRELPIDCDSINGNAGTYIYTNRLLGLTFLTAGSAAAATTKDDK